MALSYKIRNKSRADGCFCRRHGLFERSNRPGRKTSVQTVFHSRQFKRPRLNCD